MPRVREMDVVHTHYTLHVITDFFLRRIKSSVLTTTIVLHEKDVELRVESSYHNVKVLKLRVKSFTPQGERSS